MNQSTLPVFLHKSCFVNTDSDCFYQCYFQVLRVFFRCSTQSGHSTAAEASVCHQKPSHAVQTVSFFWWNLLFVGFCCGLLFSGVLFCFCCCCFQQSTVSTPFIYWSLDIKANPYWSNYTEPIADQKCAGLFFLLFPLSFLERRRCIIWGGGGATLYKRYLNNCTGSDIKLNSYEPVSPSVVKETVRLQRCWEKKK